MDDNPYRAPSSEGIGPADHRGHQDVQSIAVWQRRFLVCIAVNIVLLMAMFAISMRFVTPRILVFVLLAYWASNFVNVVAAFQLARRFGDTVLGVIISLLMLMPCLNLLVMVYINGKATSILQRNGYQVGLFGANLSDSP